jgi:hypothetical protein
VSAVREAYLAARARVQHLAKQEREGEHLGDLLEQSLA